jgi:hypothetical protein
MPPQAEDMSCACTQKPQTKTCQHQRVHQDSIDSNLCVHEQAESLFMSAFHNGQLRTMKAHYRASDHPVRIIRPLTYVREIMTREYAQLRALPVIDENCPGCFESPKVSFLTLFLVFSPHSSRFGVSAFGPFLFGVGPTVRPESVAPFPVSLCMAIAARMFATYMVTEMRHSI